MSTEDTDRAFFAGVISTVILIVLASLVIFLCSHVRVSWVNTPAQESGKVE